ncbi:MAG TPA: hypothetical protein VLU46_08900 [Thermoanaerobaculia bacterium]|nr:hypothetical protein [Thermoanaerobaculia bacterium]
MNEYDDFIVESELPDFAPHGELTGWETVVFEVVDEDPDGE